MEALEIDHLLRSDASLDAKQPAQTGKFVGGATLEGVRTASEVEAVSSWIIDSSSPKL